jgi:acetyl-CoA carboxylase biotin carboxylase subunit
MYEGWIVPLDYDPLLAKLIGYGTNRQQAIMRLQGALSEYFVVGIKTNISLFQQILGDADFLAEKLDTGYLDRLLGKSNRGGAARAIGEVKEKAETLETVAAIAAGLFAALDPSGPVSGNAGTIGTDPTAPTGVPSNWKQKGRSEGLR